MRERDIHKIIEQQEPEAKQRIWAKVSEQLDLPPRKTAVKSAPKVKPWKWAAMAMALVCVITLSVVLPLTLNGNDDGGSRFCDATQYIIENFNQTIGEYSSTQDGIILYVNWYDIADEVFTDYGYMKEDKSDVIFLTETILNGETGEILKQSITDKNTHVDIFEEYFMDCNEMLIQNVNIRYKSQGFTKLLAMFEYENYNYYLDFNGSQERLVEIIEDMLK